MVHMQEAKKGQGAIVRTLAIVGGIVVLGMGSCVVCAAVGAASKAGSGGTGGALAKPSEAPLEVTAAQLFTAYQANEVAADQQYKGRALLVKGSVGSIDKDAFGNVIVQLATSNPFMPVRATLESGEKAKAAGLSKGQAIAVACEGGGMLIGDPVLSDCTIR